VVVVCEPPVLELETTDEVVVVEATEALVEVEPEEVEEETLVELVVVALLVVLVVVAGTNSAVSVSGPVTVAVVVANFWSPNVVLPVLETQPENPNPVFAVAEIGAVEEAVIQLVAEGLVVPAPGGDTSNPTEYCSAYSSATELGATALNVPVEETRAHLCEVPLPGSREEAVMLPVASSQYPACVVVRVALNAEPNRSAVMVGAPEPAAPPLTEYERFWRNCS
jgi:hypothetical protein